MSQELFLYGGESGWTESEWVTTDDRVRGGSSRSHLSVREEEEEEHGPVAVFHGHLDTSTLGGAGFASQRTRGALHLDLSAYAGLRLALPAQQGDGRCYVVALKDELPGRRDDGRERSGVSWEAEFVNAGGDHGATDVVLPWASFRATYRGRNKPDAKPLDRSDIQRIGLMMRSFFDSQDGDFSLEIASISAFGPSEQQQQRRRREGGDDSEEEGEEQEDLRKPPTGGFSGAEPLRHSSWGWRALFCGLL